MQQYFCMKEYNYRLKSHHRINSMDRDCNLGLVVNSFFNRQTKQNRMMHIDKGSSDCIDHDEEIF